MFMFTKFMSKIMSILLFIASLLGLGSNKEVSKELISFNNDKTEVTVTLSENPSTGYSWRFEVKDFKKVVTINDDYISNSNNNLVGAAGSRVITFKGVSEGETEIEFNYKRGWEDDVVRTVIINVTVNQDLSLDAVIVSDTDV